MTFAHHDKDPWTQIAAWVFRVAGDIRYGKVEITIHDARVVQLEVTEKFRSSSAGGPSPKPCRRQTAETAKLASG